MISLRVKMLDDFLANKPNFRMVWVPTLIIPPGMNAGRWGPNYGPNEFQKDTDNKFGINDNKDFRLPESLDLRFYINNETGLNYVVNFLKELGINYELPSKPIRKRFKPEYTEQLNELIKQNELIIEENTIIEEKARNLMSQLEEYADFYEDDISIIKKDLINCDFCFEWDYHYPFEFYTQTNNRDQVKLLFDTQILHKC